MPDALLILAPGQTAEAVLALSPIRQRYGERVLVIPAEHGAALASLGAVFGPGEQAPEGGGLSTTETLGVGAWNLRVEMPQKTRHGDGLAWDTEGFDPP